MKNLFQYIVVFMMLVNMVPIGNFVTAASKREMVSIGSDDGKTINLKQGQELQLSLLTNPSTGYTWEFVSPPAATIFTLIAHYLKPLGNLPGSPSMEYWVFNTVGKGSTSINLKYWRSWEANPLKTFSVKIIVSSLR